MRERILFFPAGAFFSRRVDQFAMRRGRNPRRGVVRNSFDRPGGKRRGESLLHGLLGAIERSGNTNQACDDSSGLLTENGFYGGADLSHSRKRFEQRAPAPRERAGSALAGSRCSLGGHRTPS